MRKSKQEINGAAVAAKEHGPRALIEQELRGVAGGDVGPPIKRPL